MIITFGAPFDGYETFMPYSSGSICGDAIDQMREQLEADGLEIRMIRCLGSDVPSSTVRPMPRPQKLTNG